MIRTIRYKLHVWISSIRDSHYYVLAFGGDMSDVLEIEPGIPLRMD